MFMLTFLPVSLASEQHCSSGAAHRGGGWEDAVAWLNAALGRVAWDFLSEPHWAELVSKKIQMKLSKIRVSRAH